MTVHAASPFGRTRPSLTGEEDDERMFVRIDPHRLRRFLGFVHPYRRQAIATLVTVLMFTLAQVSLPIVIRYAVNSAIGRSEVPLSRVMVLFVVVVVLNCTLGALQESLAARLAQSVIFDLRRTMFAHLQAVSLSFLDKTQVGRLMSRLQSDVNSLQEFLEQSVSAVGDLFLVLGIMVILPMMNLELGLMTLAVVPILILLRIIWLPWAQRRFHRARDASSTVNAALAENINGIRTVQESRREAVNLRLYERKARENFEAAVGSALASQVMVPAVEILTGIAMAVVVIAGGSAVLAGTMGIGAIVAYIFYVQRFFDPIRNLSMQYTVLQRATVAANRIFEVIDVPLDIRAKPDALSLEGVEPSISFRNVTFGYNAGQPVLHDISFEVPAYQTVAFVGPTGSGKSSIASLLHRFYDVWEGEVRIGGIDVRDVSLDALGRTVAMVLQEPFLFTGTVLENIRYHMRSASEADVIAAAKAVRAHDFIERLPQGYATMLGQRGRNLSIGQRQLISFARALVADPKILILDEATANIDSFTEQQIQQALKVLLRGRTSLLIAHRLATIRDADQIIVVRQGRLIEQGTHQTLLAKGGLYAHLCSNAFASFDECEDASEGLEL